VQGKVEAEVINTNFGDYMTDVSEDHEQFLELREKSIELAQYVFVLGQLSVNILNDSSVLEISVSEMAERDVKLYSRTQTGAKSNVS